MTDDAAVYRLNEDTAVVLTVDFFPPVVDDPWTFGAVAAANAMSDVYAMGGEVVLCLNVAGFPAGMAASTMSEVLRGGAEKCAEAGAMLVGGHTLTDPEPKYGLSAVGLVQPRRLLTKAGAQAGDTLILTKALGTGLILTAAKRDLVQPEHLHAAVESMLSLNRHAAHLAVEAGVHALTDVTGYGIAGHALELAGHSNVQIVLSAGALPLLPGALDYATAGVDFGGVNRNRDQLGARVHLDPAIDEAAQRLIFDPQTSGGLLMAVDSGSADHLITRLRSDGLQATAIGLVREGRDVTVVA